MEKDGKCGIIIATSALGMGVNIQDVRQVIHYGVPSHLETYVHEVGCGVRDGKPGKATLYCRPFHLAHCDEQMCTFIKNTENKCRREVLIKYFNEKNQANQICPVTVVMHALQLANVVYMCFQFTTSACQMLQ